MAGTCCPIETEPRTLSQGQLNRAREFAVDVVQNMEASQASSIFIEGMKPVVPIREAVKESMEKCNVPEPLDSLVEDPKKAISTLLEQPCQCLCSDTPNNSLINSPDTYVDALKEPLSAPF